MLRDFVLVFGLCFTGFTGLAQAQTDGVNHIPSPTVKEATPEPAKEQATHALPVSSPSAEVEEAAPKPAPQHGGHLHINTAEANAAPALTETAPEAVTPAEAVETAEATSVPVPAIATTPAPLDADPVEVAAEENGLTFTGLAAPSAILETLRAVCLPARLGEQTLAAGLPGDAKEGVLDIVGGRLTARHLPGQVWTIPTLETPIIVGLMEDAPTGCQILATTPFGNVVSDSVGKGLVDADLGFELYESGLASPTILQSRFRQNDTIFIDVLTYQPQGQTPTTIHVVLR